jgi:Asparagine synthase
VPLSDVSSRAAAGPPADLGRVIEESVAAQLVAGVSGCGCLSGGLDSSIVTVLAHWADTEIDAYPIAYHAEDRHLARVRGGAAAQSRDDPFRDGHRRPVRWLRPVGKALPLLTLELWYRNVRSLGVTA